MVDVQDDEAGDDKHDEEGHNLDCNFSLLFQRQNVVIANEQVVRTHCCFR